MPPTITHPRQLRGRDLRPTTARVASYISITASGQAPKKPGGRNLLARVASYISILPKLNTLLVAGLETYELEPPAISACY
jgi:hypothetical protein